MSFIARLGLVASIAVVSAACAEDLTVVNAAFAAANDGWSKVIAEGKKANEDLAAKAGALAAVAAEDAPGKDLKTKFDAALGGHKEIVASLEQIAVETKGAVEKAQVEKKILPVQTALDAGIAKFSATAPKLAEAATAAVAAFDALKAHLDAAAAAAAAAAADPASKDPTTVKTAGGEAQFTFIYTDKDALDEAASAAALERLTKFLGSCDAIKVELTATGVEMKAKDRAEKLKAFVEAKGMKGKISKVSGAAGDGSTKVTVATPCP